MIGRVYDAATAKVGDTVYLARGRGGVYGPRTVEAWVITKITPKLQVTIEKNGRTERLTPRGDVVGESKHTPRSIVTEQDARDIAVDRARYAAFNTISSQADIISHNCRRDVQCVERIDEALAALQEARARLTGAA